MKRLIGFFLLGATALCIIACSTPIGIDPAFSVVQRDQLQREMPRPPLKLDGSFESAVAETDVAIPQEAFSRWFEQHGAPHFNSFFIGTPTVPGVARTEAITGAWKEVGDRRRIVFVDGSTAVEEITLIRKPHSFQYQVWNLSNKIGRYTSYAVGEIEFSSTTQGTHIRWTYSYQPKGWPDGLLIRSFVREDFSEFMKSGLATLRLQAIADLNVTQVGP